MKKIIAKNEPFVKKVVSKEEAKKIFKDQDLKLEHIDELPEGEEISVYEHGSFVDLHICYLNILEHLQLIELLFF